MIAEIITASIVITNALIKPQSNEFFIIASQSITWTSRAMVPFSKIAVKKVPTTLSRIAIQIASVSFAFSLPTNALPDSHREGGHDDCAHYYLYREGF